VTSTVLDNRYTLLGDLGGGGMARVYLAHDEVLDRDVALKVLREQYADDEEFVGRFRREARNAAALSHPNIVQIYDQGQAEDGTSYMAMEYVPGGTLKDRILEHAPLDPRDAAGIAARVARALAVAHARGIVHRDIKPQNVLLTGSGDVKVADFGIARAASATVVTQTNLVLGTAGYMAPEQASGERVGPESDLYSLGVVLYEMLTGSLLYEADTPIAVVMKHINAPPRHPREANPDVPEDLDEITVRLLAKNPEDRYASAEELARDLERVRDGLPVAAVAAGTAGATQRTRVAPAPTGPLPRPTAQRRRRGRGIVPVLGALLLALLLIGGLAWTLNQGGETGGSGRVEVPNVVDLRRDEATRRLEDAGFKVAVTERESPAGKENIVLAQSVPGGERAERGSNVELTVGAGPSTVEVPDIPYGATAEEARAQLEDLGLKLGGVSEAPSDTIAAGGVVAQNPLPGVAVEPGAAVDITLSSGPAPAPAPEPTVQQTVPVPPDQGDSGNGGGQGAGGRQQPVPVEPVQPQPQQPQPLPGGVDGGGGSGGGGGGQPGGGGLSGSEGGEG